MSRDRDTELDLPPDREYRQRVQRIEKHEHYHANGNGGGTKANDRINAITTAVAGAAITIVLGILSYQIQRVLEKVENHAERITRLEERTAR